MQDPATVVELLRALPSTERHHLAEALRHVRRGELVEVSQRDHAIAGVR